MKKINEYFGRLKKRMTKLIPHRKKKEEVVQVENTKIPKLKFANAKKPLVIFHTKHRLTKALVFVVPLLIAGAGVTLGVLTRPQNTIPVNVEVVGNTNFYRVFLLSNDNMVVPVSLKAEDRLSKDEEIVDVFNYLKDDKTYENGNMKGIIPKDCKLTEIELKNNILTLDFSEEFNTLNTNMGRSFEALTYSFLSIEGVDGLKIRVDGCLVDKVNNFKIPTVLTRKYGINKNSSDMSDLSSSDEVVMIYNKTINGKKFYTPVSVLADKGGSKIETIYNAINLRPSIIKGLSKVKEYSYLNTIVKPVIKDQEVSLDVTQAALVDEVTVSKDLYDLMTLTFDYADLDYRVNLTFGGESYAVDGIINEEDYEVSSIIYNETQL